MGLKSENAALQEIREKITGKNYLSPQQLANDNFLHRYVKFYHCDVTKVDKALEKYSQYAEKKRQLLLYSTPSEFKENYCVFGGARDFQNRPVVQIPKLPSWDLEHMYKTQGSVMKALVKKMHFYLEQELLENNSDYAVLILDLKNVPYSFSLGRRAFNISIELTLELNSVSPGVIGQCFVLNAPRIVKTLTAAGHALLRFTEDQRNQCILLSPDDENWKERLMEFIPENQLLQEFGGTFQVFQNIQ